MAKPKKYKFIGPFLRKIRVSKGIDRVWLAKKMSRTTSDLMNTELGVRGVANLRTLKSWLHHLGADDQYDMATKLYLADGDKIEIDIRALRLDERLRLVAITSAFKNRKVNPKLIEAIDEALFEKPVTIHKPKQHGPGAVIGESPVMTEYDYNHHTGNAERIREYTHGEWKSEGKSGGEGSVQHTGNDPGKEDA
jgi:hypothetical protein